MTTLDFNSQVKNLLDAASEASLDSGAFACQKTYENSLLLLHWIDYLRSSELTGVCNEHLDAVRASVVEVAGCLSIGLVRPAIFAMRSEIDFVLSWIYFKDHKIERELLDETGEGFKLKSEIITYIETFYKGFKKRFNAISKGKRRVNVDPWPMLSAHVHGQSFYVLPMHTDLKTIISKRDKIQEGIDLQFEVSEYISDVLLSMFSAKWASLPEYVMKDAEERLGENLSAAFAES